MRTLAIVNRRTLGFNDDQTVWDYDLKVGQRVEVVGFTYQSYSATLLAIIVHPESGDFAQVPAYFLTPESVAVPA